MNHLLESGMLQEFSCSPDISYILKDNSAFEFTLCGYNCVMN